MCGRFTVVKKAEDIANRFKVAIEEDIYREMYNAAPSQNLPVITNKEPEQLNFYRWGLIPFWAKDASIGYKMINARAETITQKSSFKNPFKTKRCLVVSDGFYEWKKTVNGKQPYRITLKDNSLYAYAGLWDTWKDKSGNLINSLTIITTTANDLTKDIHDRMPVMLEKDKERDWLNNEIEIPELQDMLKPYNSELMRVYPVSARVNSPGNDARELLEEIKLQ